MLDNCTAEQFKKWRHDGLVRLEAHSRWKGATQILNKLRMSNKPITEDVFDIGVKELETEQCDEEEESFNAEGWEFVDRKRELYQLVSSKLNVSCFTDFNS